MYTYRTDVPPPHSLRRLFPVFAPFCSLLPRFHKERAFHAYCVGLPRSGTHSIAATLRNFRSAHEPMCSTTIDHSIEYFRCGMGYRFSRDIMLTRDKYLYLEMESAHYLELMVPLLVEIFPRAKFIMTVRNPIEWLVSEINQRLRGSGRRCFRKQIAFIYGGYGGRRPSIERDLGENQYLYPLANYFRYWRDHQQRVIESVPKERLLVVRTEDLSDSWDDIANFLGIKQQELCLEYGRSHSFDNYEIRVLEKIPRSYVKELALKHCQPFLSRLYPDFN
ncbi:MAG: sulfotransferase [Candidatus Brocadiia bacterium]